jgi:hypothetical protein
MADHHDDLHAEQTEGFKVGEKKTIDEYQKLGMSLLHAQCTHTILTSS